MVSSLSTIIFGDINNDIILYINDHPGEGDEAIVKTSAISIGGSACNTAVLLAKLGMETHLVGNIGNDSLGQFALNAISETGLDISLVKVNDNHTSGFITITVTPGGQRTMYSYRGCNALPYNVDIIKGKLTKKRLLHISGYSFLEQEQFDSIIRIVKIAKEQNAKISLDPGVQTIKSVPYRFFQILPDIDILLISERELEVLLPGVPISLCIQHLRDNGAKTITIKRGRKGSTCFTSCSQHIAPIQTLDRVINTTGAGDAFNAGFILGHLHNLNPTDCLFLGNTIAQLVITTEGGIAALIHADVKSAVTNCVSNFSGDIDSSSILRILSIFKN